MTLTRSLAQGATDVPLIEQTLGDFFDDMAARQGDHEALVAAEAVLFGSRSFTAAPPVPGAGEPSAFSSQADRSYVPVYPVLNARALT